MNLPADAHLLHPGLHRLATAHKRLLRRVNLLIFLVMAGIVLALMIAALSHPTLSQLLTLAITGFFLLPMMGFMGVIIWSIDGWFARKLDEAQRILRDNQPLAVRIIPIRPKGRPLSFALRGLGEENLAAEPLYVVMNPFLHWNNAPPSEMIVALYCRQIAPGHPVVALQPDGKALIGVLIAKKT